MVSKAMRQALQEKEMYDKGLITPEEYDILRGYEKRGNYLEDPEWKVFLKNLPEALKKLDKHEVI